MASPVRRDARRYRRRILTIGGVAFGLLFVIGAPIYLDRVEGDLDQRVPDELADAGFGGLTASFDGQDGTISCESPLPDPEAARQAAYDVWGVRAIELDRSCRVNAAAGDEQAATESAATDAPTPSTTVPASTTAATVTTVAETAPTSTPLDFDTVASAVSGSPQLALLGVLLQEADMTAALSDASGDPVTLFAPTDEAFEALPADVLAELRADPERLGLLLWHHVVDGELRLADLTDGPLDTIEGGTVDVAVTPEGTTIDDAPISVPDLLTGNGVVHVVDAVLVPAGFEVTDPQPAASVNAALTGGRIELTGVVASEAVRAVLDTAAGSAVTDTLTVDPDTGLDGATADDLAALIAVMPANLLNGNAGFDGERLYLAGTYRTEESRAVVDDVATALGVTADLEPPPAATEEDAGDLEAELNAFVAENPILFEPSSATLSESSIPVVDQLAVLAQQFEGISIVVEGHTDSDGSADQNLQLSRMRAFTVQQALIERGLAEASVTFEGFGSQQPILVDGVEDKVASRRVEFRVETS